jgi:hypothetical protein
MNGNSREGVFRHSYATDSDRSLLLAGSYANRRNGAALSEADRRTRVAPRMYLIPDHTSGPTALEPSLHKASRDGRLSTLPGTECASWLCELPVSLTMPANGESPAQAGLAVAAALPSGLGEEASCASGSTY